MKKSYIIILFLITSQIIFSQDIVFSDPEFKNALLSISEVPEFNYWAKNESGEFITIDINDDGEIQESEALLVYELTIGVPVQGQNHVQNVEEISYFTNLKRFDCNAQDIINLNVTQLANLEELICGSNAMEHLEVSGLGQLKVLQCFTNSLTYLNLDNLPSLEILNSSYNNLSELDVSGLANLKELVLEMNDLTSLDLSGLSALETVNCNMNDLTSIDLAGADNIIHLECTQNNLASLSIGNLPQLLYFQCNTNAITELDLSNSPLLEHFVCSNNALTTLDLSQNQNLNLVSCGHNQLTTLNVKNGNEDNLSFSNNPGLTFICVDGIEMQEVQDNAEDLGYACVVSPYCSFVPGGEYFTITGNTIFAAEGNCVNGYVLPQQSYLISDGAIADIFISNTGDDYTIPIPAASYNLSSINPNPDYFTVSPESVTITFPDEASPYAQNFCVTPAGTFYDLEINIIPTVPARPGFDVEYRIIYKNKGTMAQTAFIDFAYHENVIDFVSASLTPTNVGDGYLTWEAIELQPFQHGTIDIVLNVNSPTETPAVNIDDELPFTAVIYDPIPENMDETSADNSYELDQIVVGSYDPNDKTCVEGTTITPEMAGEYVTYLIRFENTGNYYAENIVVVDRIDLEKFDIGTLQPLQSSHDYVTRITEGNKVEFIFEGIMLPGEPGDDRHGYVAFKIKTLETLQLDDTFSNTAAIYFDFNAPIITNEAVTTIALLGTADFEFGNYLTLYPNPSADILNIDAKEGTAMRSVEVYNILGQMVISVPNASQDVSIDVSLFAVGTYTVKVITDKGAAFAKFIKE